MSTSKAKDLNEALDRLARENAELGGLAIATSVILTQLLQTLCQRELNPQNAATKIKANAWDAVEAYTRATPGELDAAVKAHALAAVRQYEEQIRSVLPI